MKSINSISLIRQDLIKNILFLNKHGVPLWIDFKITLFMSEWYICIILCNSIMLIREKNRINAFRWFDLWLRATNLIKQRNKIESENVNAYKAVNTKCVH